MIILLGETREELGGSEYLAVLHHHKAGKPPRVDLRQERALQQLMIEAAARGWLTSAHDCSNGGLAVILAECCIMNEEHMIGVVIRPPSTVHRPPMRVDALLFGESAGRIVVSCGRSCVEPLLALAKRHRVSAAVIGKVGGTRLTIDPWLDLPVEEMDGAWRTGLSKAMTDGQSPSHPVTQSPSH